MKTTALAFAILAGLAATAVAYPQFQLARDQTCSSCHISPAGGNLLDENGLSTAETMSHLGHKPEFFYGAFELPAWLALGGEMRSSWGYLRAPQQYLLAFPMQLDVEASAKISDHFRVNATVGYRPPEYGNEAATYVWSREHYLMWQMDSGNEGLFVRAGRFMPVFGLRFAEHTLYERRFGGTALYTETYGAAVEYVTNKFEAHVTGFVKDPVIDPVAHDNGAAIYGEYRLAEDLQLGLEGMFTASTDDRKIRGGLTAKYYLKGPDLLLQSEGQFITVIVPSTPTNYFARQLLGQLMVTKFLSPGIMVDFGIGHFDENIKFAGLDRDALDLTAHYFVDSHLELLLTGRIELINQGRTQGTDLGGPTGGYAMFQFHYRL